MQSRFVGIARYASERSDYFCTLTICYVRINKKSSRKKNRIFGNYLLRTRHDSQLLRNLLEPRRAENS